VFATDATIGDDTRIGKPDRSDVWIDGILHNRRQSSVANRMLMVGIKTSGADTACSSGSPPRLKKAE